MTDLLFVAQIIEDATGEVVRESHPMTERQAMKLADGMGINLNWERFSTRVIAAKSKAAVEYAHPTERGPR